MLETILRTRFFLDNAMFWILDLNWDQLEIILLLKNMVHSMSCKAQMVHGLKYNLYCTIKYGRVGRPVYPYI